jgi:hypothetical protein
MLLYTASLLLAAMDLTGTWYSEQRSRGGIGALYKFQPQGRAQFSPSAIVEYHYRVDGGHLILTPPTGPEETLQITTLDARTLTLKSPQGDLTYTRVSPAKDPQTLAGKWTRTVPLEGRNVANNWNFRTDGTAVLTVPFTWQSGTYAVTGSKIRIALGTRPPIAGPLTWDGDVLLLPNAKGAGVNRYHRLE